MGRVNVCDATGQLIPDDEVTVAGWGRRCTYGPEGAEAFAAYEAAVRDAAKEAKALFDVRKAAAGAEFKARFPNGRLPDEADEDADIDQSSRDV